MLVCIRRGSEDSWQALALLATACVLETKLRSEVLAASASMEPALTCQNSLGIDYVNFYFKIKFKLLRRGK